MSYNFSSSMYDRPEPREYAVVIYLPSELESIVTPLRERFDPDYDLVAAHITLVFPFSTDRSLEEVSGILMVETMQLQQLEIQLGSIGDFYPKAPIIYWKVKECDELKRLYKRLYALLDLPLPHKVFLPHVTVAREISHHRVMLVKDHIASYLPDESFQADKIDLVSPVAGDHWVSVRTFALETRDS